MSSNVVVEYDKDYPIKRTVVKTTPSMSLKSIVLAACDSFKLAHAESYGLRYAFKLTKRQGKTELDLSLSVRFANLAPGAKLSLSPRSQTPLTRVNIALQTEEYGRMIETFNPNVSFWDILVHFEKKSQQNMTARSGMPPKEGLFKNLANLGKKPMYMMPVCIFMNKEYGTIADLMETTLEKAGLSSGSGVIRLLFKYVPLSMEDVSKQIMEAKVPEAPTLLAKAAPVASSPAPVPTAAKETIEQEKIAPVATTTLETPNHLETSTFSVENVPNRHSRLNSQEQQPVSFDREIRVFRPPPADYTMTKFDLPDSFFELTSVELKYLISGSESRRNQMDNAPLKTRAIREREQATKAQKYPKTCIRIRFPDRYTMQLNFLTFELVSVLYEYVQGCLANPSRAFTLYVTPPQRTLDPEFNFWKASLAPASVMTDGPFLNDTVMESVQDYPLIDIAPPTESATHEETTPMQVAEEDTDEPFRASKTVVYSQEPESGDKKEERKLPKWLKLSK